MSTVVLLVMFQKDTLVADISSLKKDLECPVCLETVAPPVRQCMNGHLTCSKCAEILANCSLCKQPLLKNNPTFVNNLLAVLPRPCKYSQSGCKEYYVMGDEHEDFCGFRSVMCRETDCEKQVQVNQFLTHYDEEHKNSYNIKESEGETSFPSFDPKKFCWYYIPVILDEGVGYIYLFKKSIDQSWEVLFEVSFIKKPELEVLVNITLENGDFIASNTLTAINNSVDRGTSLYDSISKTVEKYGHLCARISQKLILNLVEEDKRLTVHYSFFKKNVN